MNKFPRICGLWLLLLLGVTLWGCSTSVTVSSYRPAKIDLSGYGTVGILPFTSDYSFGSGFRVSINPFFSRLSFDYPYTNPGRIAEYATNTFYKELVEERAFLVVSPDQLRSFYAGWLLDSQLPYFSDVLKVDALVLGSVRDIDIDDGFTYQVEYSSTYGRRIKRAYYTQEVEVTIEFLVVDTKTGEIIARDIVTGRSRNEEYAGPVLSVGVSRAPWYAGFTVPAISLTYRAAVRDALKGVGKSMVPQIVQIRRTLMDSGKDPLIEQGNEYAEDGFYERALQNYLYAWDATRHPAAAYNGAIMYEVMGDYPKAIALAEELVASSYNASAFALLQNLRQAEYSKQKVEEQVKGYVYLE